ncbi:MAG: Alpha-galactosidase [Pedosphaera sp.]|nr:Alpha-galactosidase [Pedosphaera sp.]
MKPKLLKLNLLRCRGGYYGILPFLKNQPATKSTLVGVVNIAITVIIAASFIGLVSNTVSAAGPNGGAVSATAIWLDELDVSKTMQDWGTPHKNQSVDGNPLRISGQSFARGLGTHAESTLYVNLNGNTEKFTAVVGVDDEEKGLTNGSIEFFVIGDGKTLWQSGVLRAGDAPKMVEVNLAGVKTVQLRVGDGGDGISYDHADWADAKFTTAGGAPVAVEPQIEPGVILTPSAPPVARIHGPKIFGVRPGHPLLFTIPATGDRPMVFSAEHLPKELQLDAETGRITGSLAKAGEYSVTLRAKNKAGDDKRTLKIVCGNQTSLTPPMGWNSWNCFAHAVDDKKVRSAADVMVATGLINHGWSYINIDDCWEGSRDKSGSIRANEKFPVMKGLADYVHAKGLKIGLYSSPGPTTCAGFEASWRHEVADAQQYASWGFDYLKYDWCSYDQVQDKALPDRERMMKPYAVMNAALGKVDRDIVFSLCQYGMGDVWQWGAQVGGNCWRTTGDIIDTWSSMSGIGFKQTGHEKFAAPGNWNDPDMLVVGRLGWGKLRPTRLTGDEQYTHISLWCLLSAPLLIGCDMSQLDDFTFSLLSNDEVLAVDQDSLGQQAGCVAMNGNARVFAKELEDGSKAVGLFNLGEGAAMVKVNWSDLKITGKAVVRDLWRQKDLGQFDGEFQATVPRHGVVLVRIVTADKR